MLTDYSSDYSRCLLRGIVKYSKEHEPWIFYRMPLYYRELYGEDGVVRWVKKWKVDAIIAQLKDVDVEKLNKLNIPIIIQNYKERVDNICNITGDYFKTGEMAADFFMKRGFSHFAYYGFNDAIWSRERASGFRNRIEECGYELSILGNSEKRSEHWSFDLPLLSRWLLSLPKPTALLACDDLFASQITETCKICNIAVPGEIAVLGVDNDELLCSISDPPLSSIVLDVENGGYRAAEVLQQLMERSAQTSQIFNIVIQPIRIEQRQSTEKFVVKDKYILEVIEYIKAHFEDNLNINDLLGMVPLSRRLLEIKFKKEVGVSVYQYVLQYRVEQLADLLLKTDKPLMELADMCGFDGSKNVACVFYKYKKMTPLKWRNLYKSK